MEIENNNDYGPYGTGKLAILTVNPQGWQCPYCDIAMRLTDKGVRCSQCRRLFEREAPCLCIGVDTDAEETARDAVSQAKLEALRNAENGILKALRGVRCAMIEDGKPKHRIFEYEAHTNPCDDDMATRLSYDQCGHVETLRSGKDAVVVLINADRGRCEVLNSLRWIVSEIENESLNRSGDEGGGWELWTGKEREECSYAPDYECPECRAKSKAAAALSPPKLLIRMNHTAINGSCFICGRRIKPDIGPELFAKETWSPVCHPCGDKLEPELMVELRRRRKEFDEQWATWDDVQKDTLGAESLDSRSRQAEPPDAGEIHF